MKNQRQKTKNTNLKIKKYKIFKIFSFCFLLFAFCFLLFAIPVFAQKSTGLGPITGLGAYEPELEAGIGASGTMFSQVLSNVITFLTIVGALMFAIYFITGALSWISAGGKAENVQKAKDKMTNAALGLIVIVAAYSIIYIIGRVLGIPILEPGKYLPMLGPNQKSGTGVGIDSLERDIFSQREKP